MYETDRMADTRDHPNVKVIRKLLEGSLTRSPADRVLYQRQRAKGRWREAVRREVAGGPSNDDELWGTRFSLLRLRSADKHAC